MAVTDADPPEVAPGLDAVGLRVLSDVALLLLGEDIATHLADLAAARDGVEEQDRTPSACEPGPGPADLLVPAQPGLPSGTAPSG